LVKESHIVLNLKKNLPINGRNYDNFNTQLNTNSSKTSKNKNSISSTDILD